jgi:subtilisin family serine protease
MVYAARNGARVINLSITRTSPSQVLEEAIAKVMSDFDVVIVAAAGNGSLPNPSYPAAYPQVVAVGATARSDPDRRADFSNWGPLIDVVAPGVDICGTTRGNQYACTRGTSASAALVSGLAALVFSRYPDIGANEVRQIIRLTAVNLPEAGSPRWDGWGRIDMHKALTKPLYHGISPSASRDGPQ